MSETEELEAVRRWWSENWKALVAGLVIGLGAIFGWQGWKQHRTEHRMTAAHMYADFQQALIGDNDSDVRAIVKTLTADYNDTPYASAAQLKLAQSDVSHARFEDAAKRLQWVVDHGDDLGTRNIAQLRLAAVLWQLGKNEEALKQLAHPAPAFDGLYAALQGDIELSAGHRDKARAAYEKALEALPRDSVARPTVQQKLGDLAVATVSTK